MITQCCSFPQRKLPSAAVDVLCVCAWCMTPIRKLESFTKINFSAYTFRFGISESVVCNARAHAEVDNLKRHKRFPDTVIRVEF